MADQDAARNLFSRARDCLCASVVEEKSHLAESLLAEWRAGHLDTTPVELPDVLEAGRPSRPELVHPRDLPRRSLATPEGRRTLIHAIAHIEFNAINLACDAVFRFPGMPDAYYGDWLGVAAEEAEHFRLLRQRLRSEGVDYGDYPAHGGLWDMARRTAADPLARMALVPRMLEARGLDVTPGMINRLEAAGDVETAGILGLILEEETGHVAAGSRWFGYLCERRGLDPEAEYFALLGAFGAATVRPPLNREARRRAGFSERELDRLEAMAAG